MSQTSLMFHGERLEDRFHAKNSTIKRSLIKHIEGILFRFLDISYWTDNSPELFTICDYGCADGLNSAEVIYEVIKTVEDHYHKSIVQFLLIYEDQPENDFRLIFHEPSSIEEATITPKFLLDLPNVFMLASGKSFYSQCIRSETVDLALSFTSVRWLSRSPCTIHDAVLSNFTEDEEVLTRFQDQAALDWDTFLLERAVELTPGGHLFVTVPCRDGVGIAAVKDENGFNVFQIMQRVLHEMEESEQLTRVETDRAVLKMYYRSKLEIEKPFSDPHSAVRQSNLELAGLEYFVSADRLMEQWKNEDDPWSAESRNAHGKRVAETIKTVMLNTILGALDATRSSNEKENLADQVFLSFKEIVSRNPEKIGNFLASYAVSIRKKKV